MSSNRERIRQYLSEHSGVSVRSAARDLGVSYSTVSRVRATPATLADGFYQVQNGKPYRISCKAGDVFHVDDHGVFQPGPKPKRRTVQQRAE
jgi:transposase